MKGEFNLSVNCLATPTPDIFSFRDEKIVPAYLQNVYINIQFGFKSNV